MSDELPIELLEAQRKIRASQTDVIEPLQIPESIGSALDRLKQTLSSAKTIPDTQHDSQERAKAVDRLRELWNAPIRHSSRRDLYGDEWRAQYVKLYRLLGSGFTIALVGKRGPGKTQMGVELMRECTAQLKSAYYCTAMDYFMRIKDTFQPDRKETQADAQKFFAKPRLLVIDELHVRSDSAWEDNMLVDLIGKRYNALLDTLLISNQTSIDFERTVGPSIIDRLNETGGIVECTWQSFRA